MKWSDEEIAALTAAYGRDKLACDIDLDGLALRFGRHKTNVSRKARELGLTNQSRRMVPPEQLKDRPKFESAAALQAHRSAAMSALRAQLPHPRGALGMKHTDVTKAVIAAQSQARWDAMTQDQRDAHTFLMVKGKRNKGIPFANPRGSWKAAWREIGGQRAFFRSRWEANYARYLEWLRSIGQIKSWEHEAHTFWFEGIRRGVVSYLPDFRVTNSDGSVEWHEVKGWMDARSKTTIARMAKYHPAEKLVVVREKQYNEIRRKVSRLVVGWEE